VKLNYSLVCNKCHSFSAYFAHPLLMMITHRHTHTPVCGVPHTHQFCKKAWSQLLRLTFKGRSPLDYTRLHLKYATTDCQFVLDIFYFTYKFDLRCLSGHCGRAGNRGTVVYEVWRISTVFSTFAVWLYTAQRVIRNDVIAGFTTLM